MNVAGLIQSWVSRGVITEAQAQTMRSDIAELKKERSSVNIIVALSTIGAIALGLGVIMLVASNWQYISALPKVLFLTVGTISVYGAGHYFLYEAKSYVHVGRALLLLGVLLYCATIFLIAQIYHINAHSHWLILWCIVGIVPVVYSTKDKLFGLLLSIAFYLWLGFVSLRSFEFGDVEEVAVAMPVLLLVSSVVLFFAGGFHFRMPALRAIGRIYRLTTLLITGLVLLVLTFEGVSGTVENIYLSDETIRAFTQLSVTTVAVAAIGFILGCLYFLKNPTQSTSIRYEAYVTLTLLAASVLYLLMPRTTDIFTYVFNAIYIALTLVVLMVGYKREDMVLVNRAIFFTSIYLIVRYFDLFWELFDRSLFFIFGGIVLVAGGIVLESQRRKIKKQFLQP